LTIAGVSLSVPAADARAAELPVAGEAAANDTDGTSNAIPASKTASHRMRHDASTRVVLTRRRVGAAPHWVSSAGVTSCRIPAVAIVVKTQAGDRRRREQGTV
jgi:hypothetical protein